LGWEGPQAEVRISTERVSGAVALPRPEVFLSHASADAEAVKAIAEQLKERGIPVWLTSGTWCPGIRGSTRWVRR
jgi:TIR domain-containing protein